MIVGGLQAAFAKIGLGNPQGRYPYEPYMDPDPTRSIRRVSSHISVRQRKPSIVESALLSVHKIPAIVAVSGSSPAPRARHYSGPSLPAADRDLRSSASGWHQLRSPDYTSADHTFPRQSVRPNADASVKTRTDRSHTVPAVINIPDSFDFRDRDQNKEPYSAPSHTTTFRPPEIQVTAADRYAPPSPHASYDFTDMDRSRTPLGAPGSSSPSPSSMHRSSSPAMSQLYRSVSPTAGHTPYYPGPQRRDSLLRTSHAPPQRRITPSPNTNSVSPASQITMAESYDFSGTGRPSPTSTHENPEFGASYCISPMPIFTYGGTHGTSPGNTYDSRREVPYDTTQGGTYASTRDNYHTMQEVAYNSACHGGDTYIFHGQETGLTSIIGEMEGYNRDRMPRSLPAPFPSPTATISADGTLDSPYLDPTSPNSF